MSNVNMWGSHRAIRWTAGLLTLALVALTGCGSNAASTPIRSYVVHLRAEDSADPYRYVAEDPIDLQVGDEVTFEMRNAGALAHDLRIVEPSGQTIASAPAVGPGATLSLTVLFEEAGFYRLDCLVDDHLTAHGMQAIVEVTEPDR